MRLRSAAALAVSAVLIAGPGTALADDEQGTGTALPPSWATLETSYPCYSSGESVLLSGSGFAPHGRVTLSAAGRQLTTLDTDPDGAFTMRVQVPAGTSGPTRLRFTATDRRQPALSDDAVVRIAPTDVVVTPAIGSPRRLLRIRAWGFFGSAAVYAHVKRRGSARTRTIRLGTPRGACGTLDIRRRLFPSAPRPGAYTLQFDALRRYTPGVESSVSYEVAVLSPAVARAGRWAP